MSMPIILATWKTEIRRNAVQGWEGSGGAREACETTISKITRAKQTGGMA
jgi:hypothetical protein